MIYFVFKNEEGNAYGLIKSAEMFLHEIGDVLHLLAFKRTFIVYYKNLLGYSLDFLEVFWGFLLLHTYEVLIYIFLNIYICIFNIYNSFLMFC